MLNFKWKREKIVQIQPSESDWSAERGRHCFHPENKFGWKNHSRRKQTNREL